MANEDRFRTWLRVAGWVAVVALLVLGALGFTRHGQTSAIAAPAFALLMILGLLRIQGRETPLAVAAVVGSLLSLAGTVPTVIDYSGTPDLRSGWPILVVTVLPAVLLLIVSIGALLPAPAADQLTDVAPSEPIEESTPALEDPRSRPVWNRDEAAGAVWTSAAHAAGGAGAAGWGSSADAGWGRRAGLDAPELTSSAEPPDEGH